MRALPTKKYRVEGEVKLMAILDGFVKEPSKIAILARRDLIFLQGHFRRLAAGEQVRYSDFSDFLRRVTELLTEVTDGNDHEEKCSSLLSAPKQAVSRESSLRRGSARTR